MHIGKTVALAIGIGFLGGCNTTPTNTEMLSGKQYPPNPNVTFCTGSVCPVSVTVSITLPPNFTCTFKVDPPLYNLSGGPASKTITWTLNTPTLKWPASTDLYHPIQFETNGQDAFSDLTISGNVVSVTYTRPNSGHHHYAYGVNAKHALLAKICGVDPWMED